MKNKDTSVRIKSAWALSRIWDPRAEEALMMAIKDKKLAIFSGAYRFYIKQSEPETETILINALNKHGDKDMAITYLNCGNPLLEKAARSWASRHGLTVYEISVPGGGGTKWKN